MRALSALFLAVVLPVYSPQVSLAACDCESNDASTPCTGQVISVIVNATGVNGANSKNATFNWVFNSAGGDARCGQFANGDYWIAPAVGQSTVTISSITGSGPITADADPTTESMGLLNGAKNYGNHNENENIVNSLPVSYSKTTSLVAAIQRNEADDGVCGTAGIVGECVDAYNVVTVLNSVPENAGSTVIRPNITGTSKLILSLSDFDFTQLPSKNYLDGANAAAFESMRQRWSHSTEIFGLITSSGTGYSEGGRAFRSHLLIDNYAAGVAMQWNDDMLTLFSDDNTFDEKKSAVAAMLSYGLDIYTAMYDSGATRYWGTGAGQHLGRVMPPLFLAALAKNTTYRNNLSTISNHVRDARYVGPHELAQVNSGVNGPVWGDDPTHLTGVLYQGAYWNDVLRSRCYDGATGVCSYIAYGSKTQKDPYGYIDGPPNKPGTNYMMGSLGPMRSFAAIMYLMPTIKDMVNYPQLLQYVDRVAEHGVQASGDPCVTPDNREDPSVCDPYRNKGCSYYGVTWGPANPADIGSTCIKIATSPYTKVGRFTATDGNAVGVDYGSNQVEENWDTIRREGSSRRLFRNVRLHMEE